jgi:glycosyltransferase involved in cell wall biosynthesis
MNTVMPQIYIVIPVYIVAIYIGASLDSALSQTFADIEVVVVDDGSGDGSRTILSDYAARDSRVVPILLEENRGSAYARKRGVEAASGAYFLFVDGDDTLEPDACAIIRRHLSRDAVDLLQFPEHVIAEGDVGRGEIEAVKSLVKPHRGRIDDEHLIAECIGKGKVSWSLHGKAFASEPMKRACAEMADTHIVMGDDFYTFFLFLYFARTYRGIGGKRLYNYYLGRGITGGKRITGVRFKKYCGQADVARLIRKFLEKENALERYKDAYARVHELLLSNCISNWAGLDEKDRPQGFDDLIEAWGAVDVIPRAASLLWRKKGMVAAGVQGTESLRSTRKDVRTIGSFYYRMHNGGTERIMAKLTEIWLGMGFDVVLFTDEPPHVDDYLVPPQVGRAVLPKGNTSDQISVREDALRAALEENRVDMMVYHAWANPITLWDVLTVKSAGIPFVMYAHSISQFPLLYGDRYYYEMPSVYGLFDVALALSRVDRQYWGYYCDYVKWISNPVCFDIGALKPAVSTGAELLWVGRLEPLKNYKDLLDVMAYVTKKRSDAHLTVLGSAERPKDMQAFIKIIEKRGLASNISVVGYHKDVDTYYSKASIFVMTSVVEGFPTAMVESKAYGLPCVTYDLPYLEMLRDNEGMFKVRYGDKASMAERIVQLLDDSALRGTMGRAARHSVERYDAVDQVAVWRDIVATITQTGSAEQETDVAFSQDRETGRILMDTTRMYTRIGEVAIRSIVRVFLSKLFRASDRVRAAMPWKMKRFLLKCYRFLKRSLRRS